MGSYKYWKDALKGVFGEIHDGHPQPGYYRKRTGKSAGYVPVAIWEQEGQMVAIVDGVAADADEIWTWVCPYPIPEQWYRDKMDGKPWPDEDTQVTASLAHDLKNSAEATELEILQGQIDSALKDVETYAVINDDETSAKAQGRRSRLLELSGEADSKREAEKRPHLDAGTKIDKAWRPLITMAKEGADAIRKAMAAHEDRKRVALVAAQAKAAAQAEKDRLAAEKAIAKGKPAPAPAPPPPPPVEAPKDQIRSAYGRAAAVTTIKVAKVVDQDLAYRTFRTRPEMVELIASLAQRAVKAGLEIPGVTWEEKADIR